MTAGSGTTGPLEVCGLGPISNRGCGLVAPGAGFLERFRPGRMASGSAPAGLAPEGGSPSCNLVGDPEPSSRPGEQMTCCAVSGEAARSQGSGLELARAGCAEFAVSPPPARATCAGRRGRRWAPSRARRPVREPGGRVPPPPPRRVPLPPFLRAQRRPARASSASPGTWLALNLDTREERG